MSAAQWRAPAPAGRLPISTALLIPGTGGRPRSPLPSSRPECLARSRPSWGSSTGSTEPPPHVRRQAARVATVPVDRERFLGSQWSAARGHRVFCPLRLLHVFSSPFILYLFLYFFNSELRSSVETFTVIKVHSNKTFHHCSELISLSHTHTHTHTHSLTHQ